MEEALQFIVDRYNYWIVIILMMTGLYIVISRGNLVKKVVGLNIFQTSVFIFYISIGKVAGGTAPILLGGHGGGHGDDAHGAEHGGDHGDDHGATAPAGGDQDLAHAEPAAPLHDGEANDLAEAVEHAAEAVDSSPQALHAAPSANDALAASEPSHGFVLGDGEAAANGAEIVHQAGEILYSNPLPHVLILTAIVVGVATTAVGLALAVRIREAYGTIEEDELEAADDIAEFGENFAEDAADGAKA